MSSFCLDLAIMLRIGELSRRSGVSPELLRAWERRYGLLRPQRSAGGLRLYSPADLERVQRMQEHLGAGVAAAEAAALAQQEEESAPTLGSAPHELAEALDSFDEPRAQRVLDRLFATATVDTILAEIVLPYLRALGARWRAGTASVAQEHFASTVLRGRLLGLARDWGQGVGPLALLACLPDEQHELGLLAFGLALRARGCRIAFLGADTPLDTTARTADHLQAALVVLSTVAASRVAALEHELQRLASRHRVALGGAGATEADAARIGAFHLAGDLLAAADRAAGLARPPT